MDHIELSDPNPDWPEQFEAERVRLQKALGAGVQAIEHFGSTAIPGLIAKPIIDILIATPSLKQALSTFPEKLKVLDYVFWVDNPKSDRLFFVKGMPPYGTGRTHHLHVTEPDGGMWQRLMFRDYLIQHPQAVEEYASLKQELSVRHRNDREAYSEAKANFINRIMALAS